MKYNSKYDRWVTKGGLVYRYDKKKDRLVQCKLTHRKKDGYLQLCISKPKQNVILVHRLVYETIVGEIPQLYEIDHINTIRDDNRIENLRVVTHKENNNNPLTRNHISESTKGRFITEETKRKISDANKGKESKLKNKYKSEFGKKYFEHFGYISEDVQYHKEYSWYYRHGKKLRWE